MDKPYKNPTGIRKSMSPTWTLQRHTTGLHHRSIGEAQVFQNGHHLLPHHLLRPPWVVVPMASTHLSPLVIAKIAMKNGTITLKPGHCPCLYRVTTFPQIVMKSVVFLKQIFRQTHRETRSKRQSVRTPGAGGTFSRFRAMFRM